MNNWLLDVFQITKIVAETSAHDSAFTAVAQAQHILNWRKTIDGEKYCIALVKKGELPDYPKDDPEEDAIDTGYTMGWKRLRAITKERNFMQVVYVAGEEER